VEYLSSLGSRTEPGLDADAIKRLERTLGARFPDQVRELYAFCGGLHDKRWTGVPPMRLMRPKEVIETAEILRDSAEVYSPSPRARYLFTDDGSNWVGVFVRGPLKGKLTILDHDAPEVCPRFSDLSSFIDKLVEAGRRDDDWPDMDTDYPLRRDSDAALIADAGPLAHRYLDRYRAATAVEKAVRAATTALHLLPPANESVLRELLGSPHQYVRYVTLKVVGLHQATALVPTSRRTAGRPGGGTTTHTGVRPAGRCSRWEPWPSWRPSSTAQLPTGPPWIAVAEPTGDLVRPPSLAPLCRRCSDGNARSPTAGRQRPAGGRRRRSSGRPAAPARRRS